jgi:hypothetical protein
MSAHSVGWLARPLRGIGAALRQHPGVALIAAASVMLLSILLPPLVLSLARRPVDYFTFNPWLRRLPGYLASANVPLEEKLRKLPELALFWFSADSPMGGTEWGSAVDARDLGRLVLTSLLFGVYFALWRYRRDRLAERGAAIAGIGAGRTFPFAWRPGGQAPVAGGAFLGVVGLSTGPCTVMGCGAPVLPVVGLAFAGLSSGTLSLLAGLSAVAPAVVLSGLVLAILWHAWRLGPAEPSFSPGVRPFRRGQEMGLPPARAGRSRFSR